ncbi:LRR receptor-like serine threonine-protein kinase [Seminavis robusta]|uniref:LRR receptor-like serine threonine-protein kinase n=1 Tax=Seminavis robusta TaxID=568900 RepID=A0A9N8E8N8_9STRA|nr:LRR receptor-like serine threonine-protein kinase [Seminavis robusta]|eukprot:Sro776_g200940.1 LRR receptor-like serine threonine-protein kinase (466) ;mRNA; f:37275-38834
MAPTTTRDAVEAPKIEIALAVILGKEYFHHVEGSGEGNDNDTEAFMLETRQKAFDWIVNKDPIQLEFDAPNLVQRFLLVLFYFQTTRHQPWKECNPPATPQRSASGNFCYTLDPSTGDTTSSIWGDQWLSASHECQWAGMICEAVQSKEKTVVGLRMTWNQLNGPLPWEMARLPHLKQLFLSHNMLSGMLPPKLLSFSLESLHLGNNQLSGPLPARWFETLHDGNAKLINLQISSNRLTGTIPSELGISPLKTLGLRNNSLTGSLPLDLFHMGSFKSLDFVQNDLTGTLPSEIGLLTHLHYIFLSHTGIAGTLPSEIGLATQLHEIFASYSNMEGTIPEEVYAGLTELIALALNGCNFSGTISSSLGLFTDLVWLHVANNNFHGTIPNEIGALTELRQLVVNGNQLTGTVPVSVCHSVAYIENYGGSSVVTADCLPNPGTGVPTIGCDDDCCTSCCDNTGVCLAN